MELVDVEVAEVVALVAARELPTEDLDDERVRLIGAFDDDELVGCVGIEQYGRHALIRSLAVATAYEGRGIGAALVEAAVDRARAGGAAAVWGLATTADVYLSRFGFAVVDRDLVEGTIAVSSQLQGVCPDDAVILSRNLEVA